MSETIELRRKRLGHRSRYRGFREVDIIFGRFADRCLADLTEEEMDHYEALLDAPDLDVYAWVTDRQPVPANFDNAVFRELRALAEAGP